MPERDTKTRILDAAEQQFAIEGFRNTSLRSITGAANANLAAVNYHFGSKENLLQQVFERRLVPLNKIRAEHLESVLEQARRKKENPPLVDLLRAFIEPTLEFRESGPGARHFITLVGRSFAAADSTVRDCFVRLVEPLFTLLFSSLRQALPDLPSDLLLARMHFTLGAMGHTMCVLSVTAPIQEEDPHPPSSKELSEMLIQYAKAGLEAPC